MKRIKRLLLLALTLVFMAGALPTAAWASGREPYQYTIRIYAGNQGTKQLISEEKYDLGQMAYLNDYGRNTSPDPEGKYYVKGIREAGTDSSQLANETFPVERDMDFVVAYGIKGNMTAYYINYVDTAGARLTPDDGTGAALPSTETFYGNVGDKIVVSSRQIPGYLPQAYNLAKTLSANEADNVFTFVYAPIPAPAAPAPGGQAPAGEGAGAGGAGEGEGEGGAAQIEGGQAPLAPTPQDIIDLDEEDTPLGLVDKGQDLIREGAELLDWMPVGVWLSLAGLVAAAAILAVWALVFRKKDRGA